MPVPKRRHSKSRRDKKRTHKKIKMPNLIKCDHCNRLKPLHKICPHCGYYKGKKITEVKKKKKEKST